MLHWVACSNANETRVGHRTGRLTGWASGAGAGTRGRRGDPRVRAKHKNVIYIVVIQTSGVASVLFAGGGLYIPHPKKTWGPGRSEPPEGKIFKSSSVKVGFKAFLGTFPIENSVWDRRTTEVGFFSKVSIQILVIIVSFE